jgi:hypothetical protein
VDDRREVVIGEDHAPGVLGHLGPGAHGDADVGRLDGRCVVDPVAGHGHDVTLLAQGLNEEHLVLRGDTADDADVVDLGEALRLGPKADFPEFPAALSFAALLTPEDLAAQLDRRASLLRSDLAEIEGGLAESPIPRLFLIEDEYRAAITRSELEWIVALADDLRGGRLSWTEAWVREMAARADPP